MLLVSLLLDPEAEPREPETGEEQHKVREQDRRKHGRAPLAEHLPRVKIELVPPEVQQAGLDAFVRVGEEVREARARRASMVAVHIVRPKFIARAAASGLAAPADAVPPACDEPPPTRDWPAHRILDLAPAFWKQTLRTFAVPDSGSWSPGRAPAARMRSGPRSPCALAQVGRRYANTDADEEGFECEVRW